MSRSLFSYLRLGTRRLIALGLLLAVGLALAPAAIQGQAEAPAGPIAYARGEILIGWRPENGAVPVVPRTRGTEQDQASSEWRQAVVTVAELTGLPVLDARVDHAFARLAVTPGRELAEIARLRQLPWIAYAEPNYIVRAAGDARYPPDPSFGSQWNMRRIDAPGAWAVTQGSSSMVVAVVDSGLDLTHPEFPAWRIVPGWDYVQGDSVPDDENGHGTHVAGILAAQVNNDQGISGLAPYAGIRPLKVLDADGAGYQDVVAAAIYEAVDPVDAAAAPAKIINLSLGSIVDPGLPPMTMQAAVSYAQSRGVLVVAAAGNCAQAVAECNDQLNPTFYPAAYDNVLAVAASDHYDNWTFYSGYKPYVGIAAPGGSQGDAVWSTLPGGYGYGYGTSMATPLVSAAAALVWTMQPQATALDVAATLKSTADKVGAFPYVGGRNDYFGYGRLNAARAVRWAYPPGIVPVTAKQTFLLGGPLTQSSRTLVLQNPSDQSVTWDATVTGGSDWLSVSPASGGASYANPGALTLKVGPTGLAPGLYADSVHIQPIYPTNLYGFDIPVELRVSATVSQAFLPIMKRLRYAPDWFDPFAPAFSPARALFLPEDGVVTEVLPFPVTFLGGVHSQLRVSDNGLVTFNANVSTPLAAPTGCPPTAAAPNNALYALALDWRLGFGGGVYVHQPDADTYVITWRQVRRASGAPPNSFQIVFRRSGTITAHYLTIEPSLPAIVGVENYDGTYAQQTSCNGLGYGVSSGDVLAFETVLPW